MGRVNYSLYSAERTLTAPFAVRYSPPYWLYTVPPRRYEQPAYAAELDFSDPPLDDLTTYYGVKDGDILETFLLQHRVLVVGAEIEVVEPAVGLILQPRTRSGIIFDAINCSQKSKAMHAPFGGKVGRSTNLKDSSFVVEEPDYFGLDIVSGVGELHNLGLRVTLAVSDDFDLDSRNNSTKDT